VGSTIKNNAEIVDKLLEAGVIGEQAIGYTAELMTSLGQGQYDCHEQLLRWLNS